MQQPGGAAPQDAGGCGGAQPPSLALGLDGPAPVPLLTASKWSRKVYDRHFVCGMTKSGIELPSLPIIPLLSAVLDFRLLLRKLFIAGPYLLSSLDAGIALQGLITQVLG